MAFDPSVAPIPDDEVRTVGVKVFRRWISRDVANRLLASLAHKSIQTVRANREGARFGTQGLIPGDPAHDLLATEGRKLTEQHFLPGARLDRLKTWTSVYRPGEHIDSHRDREGSVQLLVCLQDEATEGGLTYFECLDGEARAFKLEPGDAMLFRARELYHWTTPVHRGQEGEAPLRTVAVARYFFRGTYPDVPRPRSNMAGAPPATRLHVFGLGAPRSGTRSIESIFAANYRSATDENDSQTTRLLQRYRANPESGRWSAELQDRHSLLDLHVESSPLLNELAPALVRSFPEARFIIAMRDCYTWLDSMLNHSIALLDSRQRMHDTWFRTLFRPEKFKAVAHDQALLDRGLPPLSSYLSYWAETYTTLLAKISPERRRIVRTRDFGSAPAEFARFLQLPPETLDAPATGHNRSQFRHALALELDESYLRDSFAQYCEPLMAEHFPELSFDPLHFSTKSSPGELELQRLAKRIEAGEL